MIEHAQLSEFGVKLKEDNHRFWVVRASGGHFIPNFIKGRIAAIGHLDNFPNRPTHPQEINGSDVTKYLKNNRPEEYEKKKVGNVKSQIEKFIHEIKAGDTIVSLDSNTVAVGIASGEVYFDSTPIVIEHLDNTRSELKYNTRLPVQWEHQFKRKELPLAVRNTLQAHQTVFTLDKHWTFIYHLIYPLFADSKNLYISNYIHQKSDVSSHAMGQLMAFYSDIESVLFGKTREQKLAFDALNFEKLLNLFESENSPRYLSFKTEVFSEGPVWWKAPLKYIDDYRRAMIVITVIGALFGGDIGPLKFPGLITPEMREKVLDFVLKRMEKHEIQKAKEELQLDIPRKFSDPRITQAIESTQGSLRNEPHVGDDWS